MRRRSGYNGPMLAARILIALLLTLVAIPPASGARGAADSAAPRLNGHADPEISAPAGVAGGGLVGVGARLATVGELTAAGVVESLPKTRVWGFRLDLAPCDRGSPELTPSSHWDYRLPYDGIAVGSPLVPRGRARVGGAVEGQSRQELLKSKASFERLIAEHRQKLTDFRANPPAFDNKGVLRNAPEELRPKIIEGRIRAIEKQITKQEGELQKILELLGEPR